MKQQTSFFKTARSFARKTFLRKIFRITQTALAGTLLIFFFAGTSASQGQEPDGKKHLATATDYCRDGNFPRAIRHWRAAALQGEIAAKCQLKSLVTLTQDQIKSDRLVFSFQFPPGSKLGHGHDHEGNVAQWRQMSNLDEKEQFNFGTYLAFFDSTTPIPVEAVELWRKSAKQGYAKAQYALAFAYDMGEGITQNKTEAAKWYRQAAAQGHPWAQLMFDVIIAEGGVDPLPPITPITRPRVSPPASSPTGPANTTINPESEYRLGWKCYQAKDYPGAFKHYYSAAVKGHPAAQYNLAFAYANGQGTAKDQKKADYWFQHAAKNRVTGTKSKNTSIQSSSPTPAPKPQATKAKKDETKAIGEVSDTKGIVEFESETYIVSIRETGKDKEGKTTVTIPWNNQILIRNSAMLLPIKMKILVGGKTIETSIYTVGDICTGHFDTTKEPEKIIIYSGDPTKQSSVTFDGKTKKVIPNITK